MSAITVQLGVVRACKACAAMIMYYPTSWPLAPGTKLMPIDAEPVADGNVVLDAAGGVGDMASDAGGMMMKSGNPYAIAAGAVLKFGGALAQVPGKIKEWGDHLHEQNRAFSQWSAGMAAVMAADDARRIQLEREQGDRRAASAKDLADARFRLDSSLAPIEDAFANLKNNVVSKLTGALADLTKGLQDLLILLKIIDKDKPPEKGMFPEDLEKRAQSIRDRRPRHMQ